MTFYTYLFYPLFSIHETNFSFKFVHFVVCLFKTSPFHKSVIVLETVLLETHEVRLVRPTLQVETRGANPPIQCGLRFPFLIVTSVCFFLIISTLTLQSLNFSIWLINFSTSLGFNRVSCSSEKKFIANKFNYSCIMKFYKNINKDFATLSDCSC